MNKITLLKTEYLRPNRTIETILLSNGRESKRVFVYDYEGVHFRLFLSMALLVAFFSENKEGRLSFADSDSLNRALGNLLLN